MKKIQQVCIIAILLSIGACDDLGDVRPVISQQEEESPEINSTHVFSSPEVGLVNYYVLFQSDIQYDKDQYIHSNIQYEGDTLRIEIIEQTDSGYVFEESYTPGSTTPSKVVNPTGIPPVTFVVSPTEKGWGISAGKSRLFSLYDKSFELPEDPKGGFDTIEAYPTELDLTIFDKEYTQIRMSYNYGPMAYDGPGHQWFITSDKELARIAFVGAMIPKGSGWDWIH